MLAAFKGKCHHCGHDHDEAPAPAPVVGVTIDDAMVERALKANYRDIDWHYGTIEETLQACQPHVVRGWMRAALTAALTPPPVRDGEGQ